MPQTQKKSSEQKLSMPVAVVIAGVLIAGAVILVGFNTSSETPSAFFEPIIEDLEINEEIFQACITDQETVNKIIADVEEVVALGGGGTPFNVIVAPNGEIQTFSGAAPLSAIEPMIDTALALRDATSTTVENFRYPDATDHLYGNPDAPVTIIEYSDFECPFCAQIHPTLKQLVTKRSNDVNWVFRQFPLSQIHPQANIAAVVSECIANQAGSEGFWQYADFIFGNQQILKTNPYQG